MDKLNNNKIIELEARIERLEELVISLADHDMSHTLFHEINNEMYQSVRTGYPDDMKTRINRLQADYPTEP